MKLSLIAAENIFSFKDLSVDLSNKSFCSITGENKDTNDSNGSGKSSLINIPRLVFFKKTSKKNIISDWAKNGMAMIGVNINGEDHLIVRQFPGDKVTIDGKDISQQELIEIIGITDNVFCNTVFYDQLTMNIFASSTPSVQMKMFTDMLPELFTIDQAREIVNADVNKSKNEIEKIRERIDEVGSITKDKLLEKEKLIKQYSKMLTDILSKHELLCKEANKINADINKYEHELVTYNDGIERLKNLKEKFIKTQNCYNSALKEKTEIKIINFDEAEYLKEKKMLDKYIGDVAALKQKIMDYQNALEIDNQCPLCMQPIPRQFRKKILEPNLMTAEKELDNINKLFSESRNRCNKLSEEKERAAEILNEIKLLDREIELNKNGMMEYKQEFETLKNNMPKKPMIDIKAMRNLLSYKNEKIDRFEDEINNTKSNIHQCEFDIKHIRQVLQRQDILKETLKENEKLLKISDYWYKQLPIIKTRLIDDNVALMESILNDYMSELYPTYNVKIDTTATLRTGEIRDKLNFSIVTDKGKTRHWDDLSGGEKCRIALGTQIAISHMLRASIDFEIYDEIFGSLDDSGVEASINLLRRRYNEGKQIFAISHNKTINSYFDDNIHIIKEGGISYVES